MISTKRPRILLGVPTPFNFKLVEKYQEDLQVDIIKPKYYPEIEAYHIIRNYFLEHPEYTHLGIACSDIVVSPYAITLLEQDIMEYDYPVISGMMNLALEFLNVYNITDNVVDPACPAYDWFTKSDTMEQLQKVGFSGFPLMIIRRDIIQKIPFERTSDLLGIEKEVNCLDISFCWRLHQNDIPIYADTRVNLLHLKELNDESQPVLVGREKPVIEHQKAKLF